jgi:hypothetical protein
LRDIYLEDIHCQENIKQKPGENPLDDDPVMTGNDPSNLSASPSIRDMTAHLSKLYVVIA